MWPDQLRRHLETLNRGSPGGPSKASEPHQPTGSLSVPPPPRKSPSAPSGRARVELLGRGEVAENAAGQHLRIVLPLGALWPDGERLVSARHAFARHLQNRGRESSSPTGPASREAQPPCDACPGEGRQQAGATQHPDLILLADAFPESALFLDLETCGFAGAAIFLVGVLHKLDGRLAVELLLARSYAEEKAVLVALWQIAARHHVLVTFNGKSFDWPMVHDRSTRYLLGKRVKRASPPLGGVVPTQPAGCLDRHAPRPELLHIDLLHHARRRWRRRLPDCRLQTLERHLCGRRRQGDIPGRRIPASYQRFVCDGDPREVDAILWHNALDLVTLLDLATRLAVA